MAQRVNEDIRFYLPADPYYYQVDNLPLEDLLSNDVRLQSQIDEINSAERGNTVGRAGFTELQPFIDAGIPGTISVRPGNFIGRTQRSSSSELGGGAPDTNQGFDGLQEVKEPPTTFGTGSNPTGTYSVFNPGSIYNSDVGRTSVFNFKGGNVSIDKFGFDEFEDWVDATSLDGNTTAPAGRIDLIGITTMNGSMDDPWVPGNAEAPGVLTGDGFPRLAVVKGAGIVGGNNRREVVIGERFITVGESQETLNAYGRNLDGDIVPNPEFGTIPSPDDVINVNFARDIMANGEISQTLAEWADSNKNASFFLPLAYVYVPQSHVEGAPIPEQYLKDIRPFFRTAELALSERQAIAASLSPNTNNPFVTEEHMDNALSHALEVPAVDIQNLITTLQNTMVQKRTLFGEMNQRQTLITSRKSDGWHTFYNSNFGAPIGAKYLQIAVNANNDHNNARMDYRLTSTSNNAGTLLYAHGDGEGGPGSYNSITAVIPCEGGSFQLYFTGFNMTCNVYCMGWITEEPILS